MCVNMVREACCMVQFKYFLVIYISPPLSHHKTEGLRVFFLSGIWKGVFVLLTLNYAAEQCWDI